MSKKFIILAMILVSAKIFASEPGLIVPELKARVLRNEPLTPAQTLELNDYYTHVFMPRLSESSIDSQIRGGDIPAVFRADLLQQSSWATQEFAKKFASRHTPAKLARFYVLQTADARDLSCVQRAELDELVAKKSTIMEEVNTLLHQMQEAGSVYDVSKKTKKG